jgi:hypothetical protein
MVASPGEGFLVGLWFVVQSVSEAFVSSWLHHQSDLRYGLQKLLQTAASHLGTVHHLERATRGTQVLADRFGGLENKGSTKAIKQPLRVRDAIHSNPAGVAQRTHPDAEWVHLRPPMGKAAKDSIPV